MSSNIHFLCTDDIQYEVVKFIFKPILEAQPCHLKFDDCLIQNLLQASTYERQWTYSLQRNQRWVHSDGDFLRLAASSPIWSGIIQAIFFQICVWVGKWKEGWPWTYFWVWWVVPKISCLWQNWPRFVMELLANISVNFPLE